jgi:signal transduction histidine kinase/CheY-like chemotaxis protein
MNDEFPGKGEAAALIRTLDWAQTPLGPAQLWPVSLKCLVRTMLQARQPMLLWWGPELVQFYNDAMLPSMGEAKHPSGMGQPARACWPEVWPVVGTQLENVIGRGESIWHEDVLVPVFRNGRLEDAWWIYNYSPAFDDQGDRAGVLIICTETTPGVLARQALERTKKEAESAREELRSAFLQAPLPIAILMGPEHRFTLANPAYEKLVGRPTVGLTLFEAFSVEEAGYYGPILDRVYQTEEPVIIRESELHLPNAEGVIEDRYIDVGYYPYHDAAGATIGVIAIINDVTESAVARKDSERRQRERALTLEREQELRLAAEAASRARDEFLAMLSHELRNPLAPIASATQAMRLRGDHHGKEREIIERQVSHLSRLVGDLLDVARVVRGKIDLRRGLMDVAEVIGKAIETASPLVEKRAHALLVDVRPNELFLDADSVRLSQVVGNLIANAAKYTAPGGAIEVAATREGHEIVIRVSDNGPGIDPELLPRIFDLFVQGTRPIDRAEGGLGLGLTLVKNIVDLHGGSVVAQNRASGGSQFVIRLPASETAGPPTSKGGLPAPQIAASGAPRRVLVVDDNRDAAEMIADLLRTFGHQVHIAHDGPQALQALGSFHAEVALLDLGLPVMDGLELARRIRARGDPPVRLVALTGYGQPKDRERTAEAGFDLHLTKPTMIDDLLRALRSDG